ncbi:MAG: lamin tail domain-containing protein, partial [Candidatus Hydrogenedentota bacterium]
VPYVIAQERDWWDSIYIFNYDNSDTQVIGRGLNVGNNAIITFYNNLGAVTCKIAFEDNLDTMPLNMVFSPALPKFVTTNSNGLFLITSIRDPNAGLGLSNPTEKDWGGIAVVENSNNDSAVFKNVIMRYGGSDKSYSVDWYALREYIAVRNLTGGIEIDSCDIGGGSSDTGIGIALQKSGGLRLTNSCIQVLEECLDINTDDSGSGNIGVLISQSNLQTYRNGIRIDLEGETVVLDNVYIQGDGIGGKTDTGIYIFGNTGQFLMRNSTINNLDAGIENKATPGIVLIGDSFASNNPGGNTFNNATWFIANISTGTLKAENDTFGSGLTNLEIDARLRDDNEGFSRIDFLSQPSVLNKIGDLPGGYKNVNETIPVLAIRAGGDPNSDTLNYIKLTNLGTANSSKLSLYLVDDANNDSEINAGDTYITEITATGSNTFAKTNINYQFYTDSKSLLVACVFKSYADSGSTFRAQLDTSSFNFIVADTGSVSALVNANDIIVNNTSPVGAIISEVWDAGATNWFIELYNPTGIVADLKGGTIVTSQGAFIINGQDSVQPYGYLLFAGNSSVSPDSLVPTAIFNGNQNDTIILYDSTGLVLDKIGFSSVTDAQFYENAPAPAFNNATHTLERKPGDLFPYSGNGTDNNDNSQDFIVNDDEDSTPQNRFSFREPYAFELDAPSTVLLGVGFTLTITIRDNIGAVVNNFEDSFFVNITSGAITQSETYLAQNQAGSTTVTCTITGYTGAATIDARLDSPVAGLSAETTAAVTIETPPILVVESVSVLADSINVGENGETILVVVKNNGGATLQLTDSRLLFSRAGNPMNDSFTFICVSGDTRITQAQSKILTFIINTSATISTGPIMVDFSCTGSDILGYSYITNDASADTKDTFVVQTGAQLEILSVTLNSDTYSTSQTGCTATVVIRNNGEAGLVIDSDEIELIFRLSDTDVSDSYQYSLYSPISDTVLILSYTVQNYIFTFNIADSATLGSINVDATCTGEDINTGGILVDTSATTSDTFVLLTKANLETVSISIAADSVTRGSTVTVVISLTNSGQASMWIDSAVLICTRASTGVNVSGEYIQSYTTNLPWSISGGQTWTETMYMYAATNASTGAILVDLNTKWYDTYIQVANWRVDADTKDTFVMQTPASISILSILVNYPTGNPVYQGGKNIDVVFTIRNSGEANAVLYDVVDSVWYDGVSASDSWSIADSSGLVGQVVKGNTSNSTYTIKVDVNANAVPGVHYYSGGVYSRDENWETFTSIDTTYTVLDDITVNTASAVAIFSIYAVPETVVQGQGIADSWIIYVTIKNTIQNSTTSLYIISGDSIRIRVDGVTDISSGHNWSVVSDTYLSPDTVILSSDIDANDSVIWRFYVTSVGDSLGSMRIDAKDITGTNTVSGLVHNGTMNDAAAPDSVQVISKANLEIMSISIAVDTMSDNQSGADSKQVLVVIRNTGQSNAININDTLIFLRSDSDITDSFTVIDTGNPTTINGNDTKTFVYWVSIDLDAPTGVIAIGATITGTDATVPNSVSTTDSLTGGDTIYVQRRAIVIVDTVIATDTTVERGATGKTVTIYLKNIGEATANINSNTGVALYISGANNQVISKITNPGDTFIFTGSAPSWPSSLSGGGTTAISFTLDVSNTANTGSVYLDGACTYVDVNAPNSVTGDSKSLWYDSWVIISPAELRVLSVQAKYLVSRAETPVIVTFVIQNIGGYDAQVGTTALTLNGSQTGYTVTYTGATLPQTITPGSTFTGTFTVEVSASAALGTTVLDVSAGGTNVLTGSALSDAGADAPDTWVVQTQGQISISSVVVTENSVLYNNDTITVTYTVVNNGQAGVYILYDSPLWDGSFKPDSFVKVSTSLDSTVALSGNGASTTFVSIYKTVYAATGTINVDAYIKAVDANDTDIDASDSYATAGDSVIITTPQPLRILSIILQNDYNDGDTLTQGTGGAPNMIFVAVVVKNDMTDLNDTSGIFDTSFTTLSFKIDTGGGYGYVTASGYNGIGAYTEIGNDTIVGPNSTDTLIYQITAIGNNTGTLRIDASLSGTSGISGLWNESTVGDTVGYGRGRVVDPGELQITAISCDSAAVTCGQQGLIVYVTLTNPNPNASDIIINQAPELEFRLGSTDKSAEYIDTWMGPAAPFTLKAGQTRTETFRVEVLSTAQPGTVTIELTSDTYLDANDTTYNNTPSVSDTFTWRVQTPAILQVLYVATSSDTVLQGSNFTLYICVKNNGGDSAADADSLYITIKFDSGTIDSTDSFTLNYISGTSSLSANSSETFTYNVNVNAAAPVSLMTVTCTVAGVDTNKRTAISDTSGFDTFNIQGAGALELVSVTSDTYAIVSNLAGIRIVLGFRNNGSGDVTNIDTPSLRLIQNSSNIISSFTITSTQSDSTFPITTLVANSNIVYCTFTLTAGTLASTATIYLHGDVSGTAQIVGGGTDTTRDTDISPYSGDTFIVLTPASVSIGAVTNSAGTQPVNAIGSGTITINVLLSNSGTSDATAIVDTSNIIIYDALGNNITSQFNVTLIGGTSVVVSGSGSTYAQFSINVPTTESSALLGSFRVTVNEAGITIKDALSGATIGNPTNNTTEENRQEIMIAAALRIDKLTLPYPFNFDTVVLTIGSVSIFTGNDITTGGPNGQTFLNQNTVANGDSVIIMLQRGDTSTIDTPITPASNGFTSASDFDSDIAGADAALSGGDTQLIANGLLILSMWKNQVTDANYLGKTDTVAETLYIQVTNIAYSGSDGATKLKVYKYFNGVWQLLAGGLEITGVANNYTLTFQVSPDTTYALSGLSVFRIVAAGVGLNNEGRAANVIVYPNPFIPYDGNAATGDYTTGIYFGALQTNGQADGFPSGTELKIYNVVGELIDDVRTTSAGLINWDAKNKGGREVASGVYIFYIRTPDGSHKVGKFAIIR